MTKTKKGSELAVITEGGNLPAVPTMLDILKEELKGLKAITESQYKTGGNIEGFPTNIANETKIENLIRMHSSIFGRAKAYNESQNILGFKTAPLFKMNNNTVEEFEYDIKLRAAVLEHAERKAELDALIKEGEGFLTKEDQYQMYMQKVAKVAKGLKA